MSRRSARSSAGSGSRSSALSEIRRLRDAQYGDDAEKKARRIDTYNAQESSIYQEVTEEEYNELVRKRREELPFVEDDEGGMGYYDDGEEQYFDADPDEDEEMVDDAGVDPNGKKRPNTGALSSAYVKRAKKMQRAKLGSGDQKITSMFFSKPGASETKSAPKAKHVKRDIDLDSMLDDLTSNPTETTLHRPSRKFASSSAHFAPARPAKREPITNPATSAWLQQPDQTDDQFDGFGDDAYEYDVRPDNTDDAVEPPSKVEVKIEEDEGTVAQPPLPERGLSKRDMLLKKARENRIEASVGATKVLVKQEVVAVPEPKPEHSLDMAVPSNEVGEWWDRSAPADFEKEDEPEAQLASETDDLQMFWIDVVEVRDRPGKLYLIGKTKDGDELKSCCVVVNNLQRYLYIVPKVPEHLRSSYPTMADLPKEEQHAVWMAMHREISSLLIPSIIKERKDQQEFRTKLVERNYAFELPDVPRGKNVYLKVKYPAKYGVPSPDVCQRGGATFSRICGATVRPLETFLIRRKLLGPGWLRISNTQKVVQNPSSYCKLEFEAPSPSAVVTITGLASPPLTVMSLSLKTCCNPHSHKHEVVAFSAITESNVNPEGAVSKQSKITHFSCIRPFLADGGARFPDGYTQAAFANERFKTPQSLSIEMNEKALLNYFLARVQREDPDLIVGHNLQGYTLDVLLSRIDNYKMGGAWSRLTRLRRGMPMALNQGEGWNEYRLDDLSNGRLLCDTFVGAKELLTSQSTYSLTHLVATQLQKTRVEVEMTDIPSILASGPDNFVKLLRHTLDDAMFVLQLMHKLEVLPLSKQLANLCGYLWSRTLMANKRAERIEYLLLHEFDRPKHKFIVPEKFKDGAKTKSKKRREAAGYAGGMVFAPKKGLYDNFVVLLDFNSLYPSIIREYNICFTTVERSLDEGAAPAPVAVAADDDDDVEEVAQPSHGDVPELPSASAAEGVLPQVIKRLLESRKQVKNQLKAEEAAGNAEKSKRLDIRQRAIKLTANSMYGCLGFRYSRFYAKPIAALITSTGRQTLLRAQEVAEQECGYDVIYGDTDSIMVDSRSDKLEDAKRIGREIQVQCNKHFKLLELEVDYIFKTILLLNKKKYASLVVKERHGQVTFEKEVKGLDMVRRDWCVLSKGVGNDILDFILSGLSRDDTVEKVHEYLRELAEKMRTGKEPLEQYVITKSLNKPPEQYPDKAKQYHVQVALALRSQGKAVGVGTHIPYVLCKEEEPGSQRRAYHPDEIKRSQGKLNVDIEWYLEAQIHPPVNRLCAHIDGTSSPQLAHCLGLDTSKFSHAARNVGDDEVDEIPSVLQHDSDRFKSCTPLLLTCAKCKDERPFPGVFVSRANGRHDTGLVCPNEACGAEFWGYDSADLGVLLSNKMHLAIRDCTKRYYQGWAVCSDGTCGARTQKQSLRGRKGDACSMAGCRGTVCMEYADQALYTQLKYFDSLVNSDRAIANLQKTLAQPADPKYLLRDHEKELLSGLHRQIQAVIERNDYNWVQPTMWTSLFS
ncbi:DNA polymerase alpha catalytic subunit [Achlya hypogyna]|uniref:DNA polymerase n=1 Tax=Achlya hypogyna TaxID=1202772 RepID=A0A1V9YWW4_ACHHY|nr:DNA polymerase alpha catalytic subunit [Achlya hypogyna]